MEEMKKELESLKRKTFQLQLAVTALLINIIFFSVTQVKQYCQIMDYYSKTIELNQDLNQIHSETIELNRNLNQILKEAMKEESPSKTQ